MPCGAGRAERRHFCGLASVDAVQYHSQADSSLNEPFLKAAVVLIPVLVAQVFKVGGRVDPGHAQCLGFVGPIQVGSRLMLLHAVLRGGSKQMLAILGVRKLLAVNEVTVPNAVKVATLTKVLDFKIVPSFVVASPHVQGLVQVAQKVH